MSEGSQKEASLFPYPGLRPFRRDESDIFFGRDDQVDELLEKLEQERFLAVVGTSGCGKSSLVRAGMIAALETGFMASAGARWRIAEMRPGDRPLMRLAAALADRSVLGTERSETSQMEPLMGALLRQGPQGVVEILKETPMPPRTNLLILVDQFEEVFRYHIRGESNEADALVALLLATKEQRRFPVYVVLTMRSDFLGDCAIFPGMPEAINSSQYLTPRLNWEQRKEAITGPAGAFNAEIEPALVNCLLNASGSDPDQLPLLQHALMRLWTRANDRRKDKSEKVCLTLADYRSSEIGELAKCLSLHADEAFADLTDSQKQLAEVLFRALCERGINRRDTRHPVELATVARIGRASKKDLVEVIEVFRRPDRSFLTPPAGVTLAEDTIMDISHESLIRRWERMNAWAETEAKSADIYRRLAQTAVLWKKGEAGLWRTPDLENALTWKDREQPTEAWAARYHSGFETVMEFLAASKDEHEAKLAGEAKAKSDALKHKWVISYAAVGILVTIIFVVTMWGRSAAESKRSERRRQEAELFASDTVSRAKEKADEIRKSSGEEKAKAYQERDSARADAFNTAASGTLSSDELLTAAAYYAAAKELDAEKRKRGDGRWTFLTSHSPPLVRYSGLIPGIPNPMAMAFSHEGTSLAVLSKDGMVRKLDVNSGSPITNFSVGTDISFSCFDNSGGRLLIVVQNTNVLLWTVAGDAPFKAASFNTATSGKITAIAFGSGGDIFAVGMESGTVNVYEEKVTDLVAEAVAESNSAAGIATRRWEMLPKPILPPDSHTPVTTIAIGPKRSLFVAWGKKTDWVSLNKGYESEVELEGAYLYDSLIFSIFSPDGRLLIGKNEIGIPYAWNTPNDLLNDLQNSTTAAANASARNVDIKSINLSNSQSGKGNSEKSRVFKRNYRLGGWEERLETSGHAFWLMEQPKKSGNHRQSIAKAIAPAFSPGGDFFVQPSGQFLKITLFDSDENQADFSRLVIRAHKDTIQAVAVSPDGNLVASAADDETIRFWEVGAEEERSKNRANRMEAGCLAFNSNGKLLAIGTQNGSIFSWDVSLNKQILQINAFTNTVTAIGFSPDDEALLASDGTSSSKLWKLQDSAPINFPNQLGPFSAFSLNGDMLGDGGKDKVEVWNWKTQTRIASTNSDIGNISEISFSRENDTMLLCGVSTGGTNWSNWNFEAGRATNISGNEVQQDKMASVIAGRNFHAEQVEDDGSRIHIWNTFSGFSTNLESNFDLKAFTFSQNGEYFAAASSSGDLLVWSLAKNAKVHEQTLPLEQICGAAISDDGKYVALATADQVIKVYLREPGADYAEFRNFEAPSWLPDGAMNASRLTGLTLSNLTIVPIDSETGKLLGAGVRNQMDSALRDYWQARRLTADQISEFEYQLTGPSMTNRRPDFALSGWLRSHPDHTKSKGAENQIAEINQRMAAIYCTNAFQYYYHDDLSNALSCFHLAIEMDGHCAKAFAGLALVQSKLESATKEMIEGEILQAQRFDPDGDVAREFVETGHQELDAEDFEHALGLLESAINLDPKMEEAHFWLGIFDLRMDKAALSDGEFSKVKSDSVYRALRRGIYKEAGEISIGDSPQKKASAISHLTGLLKIGSKPDTTAYNLRSICYYYNNKTELALSDICEAIKLEPTNGVLFVNRGAYFREMENIPAALSDLGKAILFLPKNEGLGWEKRASYYVANREFGKAISDYNEAILRLPEEITLYWARGNCLLNNNQVEPAIADFDRYIFSVKTNGIVFCNRAEAYLRRGDTNNAMLDFEKAVNVDPQFDVLLKRGRFRCYDQHDYINALIDFNNCIGKNPTNEAAYNMRGVAYFRRQEWTNAMPDFKRAIELSGTNGVYEFNLIDCLWNNGNHADAISMMSSVLSLDKTNKSTLVRLAKMYSEKGEWSQAIEHFNRAIESDPAYSEAYFWRGITYRNMRDLQSALADLNKVISIDEGTNANHLVHRGRIYKLMNKGEKANADWSKAEALAVQNKDDVTCAFAWALLGGFDKAFEKFTEIKIEAQGTAEAEAYMARFMLFEPHHMEGAGGRRMIAALTLRKRWEFWRRLQKGKGAGLGRRP